MPALRTAEECYRAGWEDGEADSPLTQQEIEQLASLHGRPTPGDCRRRPPARA
jgi:hypothetical protein